MSKPSITKIVIAAVTVVVVAVVGLGSWAAFGGDDEAQVRGTCGSATYTLSRDNDDDGLEVAFELQSSAPGEVWDISILQGDTPILTGQRTTDEDAELDVDAPAADAAGLEFTVTAIDAAGNECRVSLDD
jgi:hypothetical protein